MTIRPSPDADRALTVRGRRLATGYVRGLPATTWQRALCRPCRASTAG